MNEDEPFIIIHHHRSSSFIINHHASSSYIIICHHHLGVYLLLGCTTLLQKCCMLPPVVTSGRRGGRGGASQQGGRGMGESSFRCASWPVGGGVFSSFVFVPASRQCLWDGARATVEGTGYFVGYRNVMCKNYIHIWLPEDIRKPLGNTRTLLMY